MANSERQKSSWFAERVGLIFEIIDGEGELKGEWLLSKVDGFDSNHLAEGEDSYSLEFQTFEGWTSGLYRLRSDSGDVVVVFATPLAENVVQVIVN